MSMGFVFLSAVILAASESIEISCIDAGDTIRGNALLAKHQLWTHVRTSTYADDDYGGFDYDDCISVINADEVPEIMKKTNNTIDLCYPWDEVGILVYNAMAGWGTDESILNEAASMVKSQNDWLTLQEKYGHIENTCNVTEVSRILFNVQYESDCNKVWVEGDLIADLEGDLGAAELNKFKMILNGNGVEYERKPGEELGEGNGEEIQHDKNEAEKDDDDDDDLEENETAVQPGSQAASQPNQPASQPQPVSQPANVDARKHLIPVATGEDATWAQFEEDGLKILKGRGLINKGTRCGYCDFGNVTTKRSWSNKECCFRWYNGKGNDKKYISDTILEVPVIDTEIFTAVSLSVTLTYEEGLSPDVAKIVEDLDGISADDRIVVCKVLQLEQVTELDDLPNMDTMRLKNALVARGNMDESSALNLANIFTHRGENVQEERFADDATKRKTAEAAAAANLQEAEAKRAEVAKLSQQLKARQIEITSEGRERMDQKAKAGLNAIEEQLDELKLLDAKLETEAVQLMMKEFDETANNAGNVKGSHWETKALIQRTGIFNGIVLGATVENTNLNQVVQFNRIVNRLSSEALSVKVERVPVEETKEVTFQATSASSMAQADKIIENFGYSTYETSELGTSLGLSFFGASLGVSTTDNKASGSGFSSSASRTGQMAKSTTSLLKTKYFFEPRTVIQIDEAMVEPTPAFKEAERQLVKLSLAKKGDVLSNETANSSSEVSREEIVSLFRRFGTHVCMHVLLGGWWRIRANYQTDEAKSAVSMASAASKAIEEATAFGLGISASFGGEFIGASASVTAAEANNTARQESTGKKSLQKFASQGGVMDVEQEWKGGVSGGTAVQWRESLHPDQNSLWKVIDRYTDDCRGIWHFMEDSGLKQQSCSTWQAQFLDGITGLSNTLKDELYDGCNSQSMDMQGVRQRIMEESEAAHKSEAAEKATAMPTVAPTPTPTCRGGQYKTRDGCRACNSVTRRRRAEACTACPYGKFEREAARWFDNDDNCVPGNCRCWHYKDGHCWTNAAKTEGGDGSESDCQQKTDQRSCDAAKNAWGQLFCRWKPAY